ncbi:MAG: response regulator [Bacilli bacterium]
MKDINILKENGVNVAASLELFGDMETYNETLNDFLESVDQKLSDIKKYKEQEDMPNYAILVHSLKSDSKYLGFTKLADLSYQHELESKNSNIQFVNANYEALVEEANKMINLVKNYLGQQEVTKEKVQEIKIKDKTILIVDDSDIIRNFVKKIFNDTYEVMIANDGKEAIDIVSVSEQDKLVGLFLDLNMPNVDGFQVLEYFKNNNLFKKIPVSIITGDDSKEAIEKAFTYPIVDMLNKPFNEHDVKVIVEKTINYGK